MSYQDGTAKMTGRIGEREADNFLIRHGFNVLRPPGQDIGVDRLVNHPEASDKEAKVQVKGRRQESNPRWFQLTVTAAKIRDAYERGEDLEKLWRERIYQVDFWLLVSTPKNEIWVFPSEVIFKIAAANHKHYKSRRDNQYEKPDYDKNGKIQKKQKELNLDVCDEGGSPLWKKYQKFLNNPEPIYNFITEDE